jgi:hypothetical protein
MRATSIVVLSPFLLLLGALSAQATHVAPTGFATLPGAGGNSIPLWSGSATYMQVHDASDLTTVFPSPVATIKAISFRVPHGGVLAARSMDVQITMGTTPVSANTATTTFATNLGPNPQIARPYAQLNLPAVATVSNPNPQGWFFPLQTPYTYAIPQGNLCYELRFRNMSVLDGQLDDVSGASALVLPLVGTGCTATGQTSAATIGFRSLDMFSGAYVHRLDRSRASSSAAMFIGDAPVHVTLPGLCGALETLPVLTLAGTTNGTGSWNVVFILGQLYGLPRVTIYTQFAWLDQGLPLGLGLSDCSPITLPPPTQTRIWAGDMGTGQGNENATTGNVETDWRYALITGFDV